MIPRRINNATGILEQPGGWDEDENGRVASLAIRAEMQGTLPVMISVWEPTPAELELLNAGGSVVLTCANGHPPVRLSVELQGLA